MRTTIELSPAHYTRVVELAAAKGQKGFSGVIAEAVDYYLETLETRSAAVTKALESRGALATDEAEELAAEVRSIRENWR